jgi:hypothetical protein
MLFVVGILNVVATLLFGWCSQSTLSSYLTGKTRATGWTTLEKKLLNWLQQQQQQPPSSSRLQQQQQQQQPQQQQQQQNSIVSAFYYETHDQLSLGSSTENSNQTFLVTTNRKYHQDIVEVLIV